MKQARKLLATIFGGRWDYSDESAHWDGGRGGRSREAYARNMTLKCS